MQNITSRKNPLLVHIKKLGQDPAYRRECGEFLCDGDKLYQEAVNAGVEIIQVLTSCKEMAQSIGQRAIFVPQDVLNSISTVKTPQNVVFTCKMQPHMQQDTVNRVLILDGVQDPGNAGTLIRTAYAFAVDAVLLVGNSADIYSPKTVRATMGAMFKQKVCCMDDYVQLFSYLQQQQLPLYGAALAEESISLPMQLPKRVAIAIGSEGGGLSNAIAEQCAYTVKIPMQLGSESLNAAIAGGIILWEMFRQQ